MVHILEGDTIHSVMVLKDGGTLENMLGFEGCIPLRGIKVVFTGLLIVSGCIPEKKQD